MTVRRQRAIALELANVRRSTIADIRRRALSGELSLRDLMLDPPEELLDTALIDVIRLRHSSRVTSSVARLGRLAVHAQINLMLPLGRASENTRMWVAANAEFRMRKDARRVAVHVVEQVA